ncbi:hypothetical protein [Methylocapsa palsarum]|uniref:Fido domain-containing protein n=1 Tax=Methylocapsa palsarum TaxID=1612308 RepID=A0A1I4BS01_9HYPH|nr:hypothetical protein [Methylocapsa palsarum]SFK70776.1 hypothetical protein SAMN05444581_1169 [Methylocapsa palsarum]
MAVLNLSAIDAALHDLQRDFPRINKELFDRRDPLDDEVVDNMLEGYAAVDRLIRDGTDIFAMGQLHHWLELNNIVLCGRDPAVRARHHRLSQATASRFYEHPDGGIREVIDWYAVNSAKGPWRRGAGVYIRVLSDPQLFIEGNHRTGALIVSYLLARDGRPPFVLTRRNAREFFNPSSVFKKSNKRSVMMRLKMPGLTSAFADFLKAQSNQAFLAAPEPSRAPTA